MAKNGTSTISASAFAEYMRTAAAMWEWLAYVKLRGVGGNIELAKRVEREIRQLIHSRAAEADATELANETRRMRMLLEKERTGRRRTKDIDIKYGAGGTLDIYFAMRFLQLRDDVPDADDDRTTGTMLSVLRDRGSITPDIHDAMVAVIDSLPHSTTTSASSLAARRDFQKRIQKHLRQLPIEWDWRRRAS
jgi:glutamine synthetase adenylyltransferase